MKIFLDKRFYDYYYEFAMATNRKCMKCGYDWVSRRGMPKSCPRCKRYDWKEPVRSTPKKFAAGAEGK